MLFKIQILNTMRITVPKPSLPVAALPAALLQELGQRIRAQRKALRINSTAPDLPLSTLGAATNKAIVRMQQRQGWLDRCMQVMSVRPAKAVVWQRIRQLQRVCVE